MVNPGSFHGSRKEFLMGEKAAYAAGVVGGYAADALTVIQRRYFKRYPVDLPHEEEPTEEHLLSIDDNSPEPEQNAPDVDVLGAEAYAAAMVEVAERRALVIYRKAQIKRWLAYQYMKDQDLDPADSGAGNPYRVLIHKLIGVPIKRPRLKTPVNVWRKTQRDLIDKEVTRRLDIFSSSGSRRKDLVGTRDRVAREMFAQLSAVDQAQWADQAKEEHEAAIAAWTAAWEGKPSTTPAARQKCIQGLTRFVQPILDSLADATGWKVTLIAGGPEPADGGRLNILSVHSGTTPGDIKMNFGCAERAHYKKFVVPAFGLFLQKCYTIEECHARALSENEAFPRLSGLDLDGEGVNFDTFERAPSQSSDEHNPPPPPPPSQSTLPAPPSQSIPVTLNPPPSSDLSPLPPRPSVPPSPRPSVPPSPRRSVPPSPHTSAPPPSPGSSPPRTPSIPPSPELHAAPSLPQPPNTSVSGVALSAPPALPPKEPSETSRPSNEPSEPRRHISEPPRLPRPPKDPLQQPRRPNEPSSRPENTTDLSIHATEDPEHRNPGQRPRRNLASKRVRSESSHDDNGTPPPAKRLRSSRLLPTPPPNNSKASPPRTARPNCSPANPPVVRALADHPSSTTSSPALKIPLWFQSAKDMFQEERLGAEWMELVRIWSSFEEQEKYLDQGYLKAKNRPFAVKDWIQRARPPHWRPDINNLVVYEEDFRDWWTTLQPGWRISDGNIVLENVEGDWSVLRKSGVNGILSVIAALFFWGCHLVDLAEDQDMWASAVQDCIQALTHLVQRSGSH